MTFSVEMVKKKGLHVRCSPLTSLVAVMSAFLGARPGFSPALKGKIIMVLISI